MLARLWTVWMDIHMENVHEHVHEIVHDVNSSGRCVATSWPQYFEMRDLMIWSWSSWAWVMISPFLK